MFKTFVSLLSGHASFISFSLLCSLVLKSVSINFVMASYFNACVTQRTLLNERRFVLHGRLMTVIDVRYSVTSHLNFYSIIYSV
jgi:hypothetical protein